MLVPFGMWICGFLLVVTLGTAAKRRLLKILLWTLPVFLLPAAWSVYVMVVISRHGL